MIEQKFDLIVMRHHFPVPAYSGYVSQNHWISSCQSTRQKVIEKLTKKILIRFETKEKLPVIRSIIYQ